jgi:hypothetical protein
MRGDGLPLTYKTLHTVTEEAASLTLARAEMRGDGLPLTYKTLDTVTEEAASLTLKTSQF